MLKIRLQRVGRKHDPSFRIVLTDSKNGPKSGKFLEVLGNYDAKKDVKVVDGEKVKYWISKGAQVSDTIHNILVSEKVLVGKKKNVLPKKSPIVKEKTDEEVKEDNSEQSTGDGGDENKETSKDENEKDLPAETKETPVEEIPTEEPKEEEKPTE